MQVGYYNCEDERKKKKEDLYMFFSDPRYSACLFCARRTLVTGRKYLAVSWSHIGGFFDNESQMCNQDAKARSKVRAEEVDKREDEQREDGKGIKRQGREIAAMLATLVVRQESQRWMSLFIKVRSGVPVCQNIHLDGSIGSWNQGISHPSPTPSSTFLAITFYSRRESSR